MPTRKRLTSVLPALLITLGCSSAPTEPAEEQLLVEPTTAVLSASGDSTSLQVIRRGRRGERQEACASPKWRSENRAVAVVRGNGNVVATGLGVALIVAGCGAQEASATVQVGHSVQIDSPLRAFPEAEGYGAGSLRACSRSDLRVARVTNLDDSGPGSLREALDRADGRNLTVVTFDVAGYLDLENALEVREGCIYVAGQTAPGDGVTLRGDGLRLQNAAHDVVIRYLRFRPGYSGDRLGPIPVYVRAGSQYVLDHISVSWANEKLVMISRLPSSAAGPISDVTVQRSMVAEPLAKHPTGMNISGMPKNWEGSTPPGWSEVTDITVHHNLFVNSHHRNPNVAGQGVEVVNNVVYNWKMDAGKGVHGARADWVNNFLKPGPMYDDTRYEMGYRCEDAADLTTYQPSLYFSGNVGPRSADPSADPWTGPDRSLGCYNDREGTALNLDWRRDTRLPQPAYPVTLQSADAAYGDVLADVGANRGLKCDGTWRSRRDGVDERLLDNVRQGTGPSNAPVTEDEVGGFPRLAAGSACADGDADGLPDEFESRYGFDANNGSDAWRDSDGDGYTNLEEYLNGSNPR